VRRSDLSGATLTRARFIQADLDSAFFVGTTLDSADMTGSDLTGATLDGTIMRGTCLLGIRGWQQIKSFEGAVLVGVGSPPDGFMHFAWKMGAHIDKTGTC
jgi:uncharacterized protein YjbI with pentapeptide repeats